MLQAAPTTLVALGIVTAVGVGFAFFGYDLADRLLTWIGWLAGAGAGGTAAWFLLPRFVTDLTPQGQLVGGVILVVVGAIAGRILIPLFSRFTVVIAGFVATSGSTLVMLAGGQITGALVGIEPTGPPGEVSREVATALSELPLFTSGQFQQFFAIAVVAGLLGAIVAARFYQAIITAAATAIGAALLGVVVPMWQEALNGGVDFGGGLGGVSPLWFGIALVLGIGFQLFNHGDDLDLPFVDEEPEPLEEK
jgi:hypothetical protein